MIEAYDYSQLNPGDTILVTGSRAWTSYRLGVITKVKSHSVDAIIFLDGGLEYKPDIWHENDPRLSVMKEGTTLIRGLFKETEMTKRLKMVEQLAAKIESLENTLTRLQEWLRGRKAGPQENRGHLDDQARAGQRS